MGIPLDIYTLYRLAQQGNRCEHFLLLRVERPGFCNAIEPEYEAAIAIAQERQTRLLTRYHQVLAHQCPGHHSCELVGELQCFPVGEELLDADGGFDIDLWVAETQFGCPWVVMGTAASEEEFWQGVEADDDLMSLKAIKPAVKRRVWFLTQLREED